MAQRLLSQNSNLDTGLARQYHQEADVCGRLDEAESVFRRLLRQHPRNIEIHGLYIALCLKQGNPRKALSVICDLLSYVTADDALLDAALSVRKDVDVAFPTTVCKTPDLSVCMIVRNECVHLAQTLHNIKGLADEIILVDTGSEDRTMDIARIFGVRLFSFAWKDDFASARNYSLEHAKGNWVLVLDADERIAPEDFAAIRAITAQKFPKETAFAMTTRNYSRIANTIGLQENNGIYGALEAGLGWFPSTKVRLFRNHPQIRFHFPVHERVEPALRKHGVAVETCAVPVHHYGHLNESRNQEKARHYYRLGYAKLDQMENDPHALRELAAQAGQMEQWEEAIELWARLLKLVPDYPEALINLAGAYWQKDDYHNALQFSQKAVHIVPKQKEARFNLALSLMMSGKPHRAAEELNALLENWPDYVAARFMTAVAACVAGDQQGALQALDGLTEKIASSALIVALDDMMKKCRRSNLDTYAEAIAALTSMHRQQA